MGQKTKSREDFQMTGKQKEKKKKKKNNYENQKIFRTHIVGFMSLSRHLLQGLLYFFL